MKTESKIIKNLIRFWSSTRIRRSRVTVVISH